MPDQSLHAAETLSEQDAMPDEPHFGGDQSPLNDADADEDRDPEGELDLGVLGLDDFADSDKLDIGSSTLG